MSQLLNTGLDAYSLALCIRLCESGTNPEALAGLIKDLRAKAGPKVTTWLWAVMKLLLLSHGQASVERGFSTNKQVAVENLAELSYIFKRVICEAVKNHGGLLNVSISKELKASVRQARHRYAAYLDEQKKQALSRQATSKRKELEQELDKMLGRRSKLQKTLKCLLESADRFSEEAEAKNDLTYLVKANSFRRTAKEKELEIASVEKEIHAKTALLS
ncbi:hypothetical protein HPB48_022103 [Haemaphysalis longicornis]|uniref:Uncharacterized protein n=1 Tax=Haemaphysalis longicornis TaxID=44386 RepID=A0A9J6FXP1_HAELO|nr:hypothetical protein HPB48_022103 [Haemaphysalis longicornis]